MRRPSGLVIQVEAAKNLASGPVYVPEELRSKPQFGIVVHSPPSSFDQIEAFADELAVGLDPSTLDDLRQQTSELGFEIGMVALGWVAAQVAAGSGRQREIAMADRFYTEPWLAARLKTLAQNQGMRLFAEQHISGLQRLLVQHALDLPLNAPVRAGESVLLERTYLGMSSLTLEADGDERDEAHWLAYLLQNGAYHATEPLLEAMSRTYALFTRIARDPRLRGHHDYVPLAEWAEEDGLTLAEQLSFGFAVMSAAMSSAEGRPDKPVVLLRDRVEDIARRLGVDLDRALDLISAERDWYRTEFAAAPNDARDVSWNRLPFEKRPLLSLADGSMLIISPRALTSWLTDGFYYRALERARKHGVLPRFTRFFGVMIEHYICELVAAVYPDPGSVGVGAVHREQPYGAGKLTPDLAIDLGYDLVLIEVVSSRLTAATRLRREQTNVEADLDKVLIDKVRQLSNRIDDLIAGEASVPGVDLSLVNRIWPVLVTPSGLTENELLWNFVDKRVVGHLEQAKVQPLTLLDFADLERMTGLVEAGHSVPHLLRLKTTGVYRRIDFRRFVSEDPTSPTCTARGQ